MCADDRALRAGGEAARVRDGRGCAYSRLVDVGVASPRARRGDWVVHGRRVLQHAGCAVDAGQSVDAGGARRRSGRRRVAQHGGGVVGVAGVRHEADPRHAPPWCHRPAGAVRGAAPRGDRARRRAGHRVGRRTDRAPGAGGLRAVRQRAPGSRRAGARRRLVRVACTAASRCDGCTPSWPRAAAPAPCCSSAARGPAARLGPACLEPRSPLHVRRPPGRAR